MAALTDIDPNIRTVAPRVKRARLARSINLIERSPARSPEERAELALLRSAELVRAAQGPGKKPRSEYLGEQWRKAWATPWGHGRLSQAPAILRSDVSSALFAASVVPATESKRGLSRAADRVAPLGQGNDITYSVGPATSQVPAHAQERSRVLTARRKAAAAAPDSIELPPVEEFTATDVKNGRDRIRAFVAGFVPSPAALVRATIATVSLAVHLELDADDLNELLRRILAENPIIASQLAAMPAARAFAAAIVAVSMAVEMPIRVIGGIFDENSTDRCNGGNGIPRLLATVCAWRDPNDTRDNCRREQCPYHKRPAYSARWARILLLKGFEWWIRFHNTKHGEIDHAATAAVKKGWKQYSGGPKPPTIYKTLWTDKNGVPHQFKYARGGMYLPAEVYRELGNDPTVQALAVVLRSSFPHRGRKAVAARFLGRWLKVARSHQGRIKRITGWGVRSTWRPLVAYSRDDRVYADSQGMKLPPWRPAPASNAKIIAAVREAAQLPYEGDPVAGSKSCTWAPLEHEMAGWCGFGELPPLKTYKKFSELLRSFVSWWKRIISITPVSFEPLGSSKGKALADRSPAAVPPQLRPMCGDSPRSTGPPVFPSATRTLSGGGGSDLLQPSLAERLPEGRAELKAMGSALFKALQSSDGARANRAHYAAIVAARKDGA